MRIAIIVTGGLHPSGRDEVIPALLGFVEQLAEHHDVHAFALRHMREPRVYLRGRATVHDLGSPRGRWKQWRAVTRAIASCGPFDVVHGYWVDPAGVLAALIGRQLRIPCVVTCDSGEFVALPMVDYGLQRTLLGRRLVSYACRRATTVHVTSVYMQRLARLHGIDAECIPLGIALERFVTPTERLNGSPWRLVQVASLNRVKDHSMLLDAFTRVRRRLDVRLDLVGEDTLNGALHRQAAAVGIADAVTFHGWVAQDRLAPFFAHAHLYVQSSRHEAAGIAVLEAAASGLPIVGTRVGFVSDWDGAAALGVAPGNPEALADAIVRLLEDPRRRNDLANAARRRVADYHVKDTAAQFEALLSRLCPGRQR